MLICYLAAFNAQGGGAPVFEGDGMTRFRPEQNHGFAEKHTPSNRNEIQGRLAQKRGKCADYC